MAGYIAYEEINPQTTNELTSDTYGRANGASVHVRGEIRVRFDGILPIAGGGQPVNGPATITLTSADQLQKFRFSGSGILYCHYFIGDNLFAADVREQPSLSTASNDEKFDELIRLVRLAVKGLALMLDDDELLTESESEGI